MVSAAYWIPRTHLKVLVKQIYHVAPDIVFGAAHAMIGLCFIGYVVAKTGMSTEAFTKKYRLHNIVIRPEDPRVKQIKHVSGLDLKQ